MHRKGIVHRDIKPDNILLIDQNDLSVCITDLGMACLINDEEELRMKCGSPGYVAPEILKSKPATTKADIFSLGSLFFNLISGASLFKGSSAKEVLRYNKYTNPTAAIETKLSG
jgi:calcium/calmodulin-dependent protein kinase I